LDPSFSTSAGKSINFSHGSAFNPNQSNNNNNNNNNSTSNPLQNFQFHYSGGSKLSQQLKWKQQQQQQQQQPAYNNGNTKTNTSASNSSTIGTDKDSLGGLGPLGTATPSVSKLAITTTNTQDHDQINSGETNNTILSHPLLSSIKELLFDHNMSTFFTLLRNNHGHHTGETNFHGSWRCAR